MARKPYPTEVSDVEWSFVVTYLVLMRQDAEQRSACKRNRQRKIALVILGMSAGYAADDVIGRHQHRKAHDNRARHAPLAESQQDDVPQLLDDLHLRHYR